MSKWFLILGLITIAIAISVQPRPPAVAFKTAEDSEESLEVEEDEEMLENAFVGHLAPSPVQSEVSEDDEDIAEVYESLNGDTPLPVDKIDPSVKIRTGRYTLHTTPLRTWADAAEYCRNDYQHLVRLETSLELRTVLAHFVPGVTQVWTDGIGDMPGKKYMWSTTGNKVDINELETVREDEDVFLNALVLERKGLVAISQKKLMPFICELS